MGVVYLGRGRRGRRGAVKVLHPDLARDAGFRARFEREAEAAARVVTKGTARVLDVGDGKAPYLVTEYVEGPTLRDAVGADGPLEGPALHTFAIGLAEAMAAMHAAGVTHRDLTPGNVILGRWGPKVIDFGIARPADAETLTRTGIAVGTPAWMAPEQAQGRPAGPPADAWAWGALVAYAGTGRHPFGVGTADAVLYRIVHEAPALDGLDGALAPTVGRALATDPAARPSPDDVLRALSPLGPTRPTAATAVGGVPYRRGARRWPRIVAVLVAAGAVAAALGVGLLDVLDREDGGSETASPPTPTDEPSDETVPSTEPAPPSTEADVDAYCGHVEDYYERYDEFQADLDLFVSDEDYDAAFVEFARDNGDLWRAFRDTAPSEIAADVDLVADAFEQAADGNLEPFDTDAVEDAEDVTSEFEERECGIDRGLF